MWRRREEHRDTGCEPRFDRESPTRRRGRHNTIHPAVNNRTGARNSAPNAPLLPRETSPGVDSHPRWSTRAGPVRPFHPEGGEPPNSSFVPWVVERDHWGRHGIHSRKGNPNACVQDFAAWTVETVAGPPRCIGGMRGLDEEGVRNGQAMQLQGGRQGSRGEGRGTPSVVLQFPEGSVSERARACQPRRRNDEGAASTMNVIAREWTVGADVGSWMLFRSHHPLCWTFQFAARSKCCIPSSILDSYLAKQFLTL